jgi:hypothetical protein
MRILIGDDGRSGNMARRGKGHGGLPESALLRVGLQYLGHGIEREV